MKKILVACGTGICTSTAVMNKLKKILDDKGFKGSYELSQCKVAEVPSKSVNFDLCIATTTVSEVKLSEGAFIEWDKLPEGAAGIKQALLDQGAGLSLTDTKVTTLQDNLDSLIPGLAGLLLTLFCMWLLKKKVSPIVIILGLFAAGIVLHLLGIM